MKIALASVAAILMSSPTLAQPMWYYCAPAHAYYPYVSTCPVPWQPVAPTPQSRIARPTPAAPARNAGTMVPTPKASHPAPAVDHAAELEALLAREKRLNDRCRGDSGDNPKTQTFCDERDKAVEQLEAKGWCWGPAGAAEYEKTWRQCPDGELDQEREEAKSARPAPQQPQPAPPVVAGSPNQHPYIDLGDDVLFVPSSVTEEVFHALHPQFRCSMFEGENWCSTTSPTHDDCLGLECTQITYVFSGGATLKVYLAPSAQSWQRVFGASKKRLGPPTYSPIDSLGMHMDTYSWEAASPSIVLTNTKGVDVYGRPIAAPYDLLICVTKYDEKVE
jgi:hypothetical protein